MKATVIDVSKNLAAVFIALVLYAGTADGEPVPEDTAKRRCPEGVETGSYDRSEWPSRLVIAYITIGTEKETLKRYRPLVDFLSCRMGIEISPVVVSDYQQVYKGFAKKQMDAAYMGPMSYVQLCDYAGIEPVAKELDRDGKAGYHGLIITRRGSGIESLSQARGKKMAMVSLQSTSGFYMPTIHILETFNMSPASYFSKVVFAGTHEKVIEGVAKGSYDLGATDNIDLERAVKEKRCEADDIKVIWKSRLYPPSPYAVMKSLPRSFKSALEESMMAVNDRPEILKSLGIGGFAPVEDSEYDEVREIKRFLE